MYGDLGTSWSNYQIRFHRVSPKPPNHSRILILLSILDDATYTKVEIRTRVCKECPRQIFCAEDNGLQFEQVGPGARRVTTLRAENFLGTRVQT